MAGNRPVIVLQLPAQPGGVAAVDKPGELVRHNKVIVPDLTVDQVNRIPTGTLRVNLPGRPPMDVLPTSAEARELNGSWTAVIVPDRFIAVVTAGNAGPKFSALMQANGNDVLASVRAVDLKYWTLAGDQPQLGAPGGFQPNLQPGVAELDFWGWLCGLLWRC